MVHLRKECHGEEESFMLLQDKDFIARAKEVERPRVLPAAGVSETRRSYLEHNVAEYFAEGSQLPWEDQ